MAIMGFLARRAGLRVFRLFARPLARVEPPAGDLRFLREEEMAAFCADAELDLAPEKVGAAFARGDRCAAAFEGGRLAGYCWFAFAPLPLLDDVWVDFARDAAWVYKSYVRPEYRERRIATRLYRFADPACLERGRRVSLVCVESHNGPSIGAALAADYGAAGWAAYRRGGGRLSAWYSPRARGNGLGFFNPAQ